MSGYLAVTMSAIHLQTFSLASGYERRRLLSQYIGDFHPDAHVNGFSGLNITALIPKRDFATAFSTDSIIYYMILSFLLPIFAGGKPPHSKTHIVQI